MRISGLGSWMSCGFGNLQCSFCFSLAEEQKHSHSCQLNMSQPSFSAFLTFFLPQREAREVRWGNGSCSPRRPGPGPGGECLGVGRSLEGGWMGCPLWGQEKAPEDHGMGEGQQFCCWRKRGGSPNCWSPRLCQGSSHLLCSRGLLPALSMGFQ